MIHPDIDRILFDEQQLARRVAELGAQISADYAGKEPLIIGVLKGSVLFMTDLLRCVTVPCRIDFLCVSSYGDATKSSGTVHIIKDIGEEKLRGQDVLIVEDVVDSGLTMATLKQILLSRKPASLKICSLMDKPKCRKTELRVDYAGFTAPDEFLVGYGLDYAEKYRNLPYIGVLRPEIHQ